MAVENSSVMPISDAGQTNSAVAEPLVRVLYILGAGRSGSTLLDTVLASHPDVVGVGELLNLHSAGWTANEVCACGQLGTECSFWTSVRNVWQRRVPGATIAGYVVLQKKFEFFRWFGLVQIVHILRNQLMPTTEFRAYLRQTEALYQAIAEVSGRAIVVDSSKSPVRGVLLTQMPGIDTRLIHLVRDARAVAWSRKKAFHADQKAGVQTAIKPRSTAYSVGYWAFINLLSMLVCQFRRTTSLRMRYEDFVSQPQQQMERISGVSGLDYAAAIKSLLVGEPIRVEHPIAGNRMRMNGSVTLKPDWEWLDRLPNRDRVIAWCTAGWLLLWYGYGWNGSGPRVTPTYPKRTPMIARLLELLSGQPATAPRS